jgi:uncharacterized protein (DUF1697 family)
VRWVALLRAVNLAGRNKVPMAELRALLERAGYADVRTYIASGNVLVDGPEDPAIVAGDMERIVETSFDVTTTAILRSPAQLASTVAAHPFGADTARSHVAFLASEPSTDAATRLEAADHGPDRAVLVGGEVYLHYPAGFQGARLSAARVERILGVQATMRNWRTVAALAELAHSPGTA